MIPVVAALWQYRRAIGWALVVVAVGLAYWRVSAWHDAYKALPEVEAALEAEVACGEGSECEKRQIALQAAAEAKSAEVVQGYEQELAGLRSRPARVVRVCNDRGVQGAGPAGTADGTGPAAGVVSGPAGPDIGQDLYQLARDADEVAARLRALQQWNEALSAD